LDDYGRVLYRYKRPFRDGSTHVVLEPLDFMARLAALVPRPLDSDKPLAPMTPDQVQGSAAPETGICRRH
jgi:hypothetical protein